MTTTSIKGPFKLSRRGVTVGDRFNHYLVIITDAEDNPFLSVEEYITEVFEGCTCHTLCNPTFMAPEPEPYSEKARFILRALNAAYAAANKL